MIVANKEIRTEAKQAKIPLWAIADKLGICEVTLIRWLRKELSTEKKERIRGIIEQLRKEV